MINTGALRIPRSQAALPVGGGRPECRPALGRWWTTSSETPWVNPADGARRAAAHTASTASGGTGRSGS